MALQYSSTFFLPKYTFCIHGTSVFFNILSTPVYILHSWHFSTLQHSFYPSIHFAFMALQYSSTFFLPKYTFCIHGTSVFFNILSTQAYILHTWHFSIFQHSFYPSIHFAYTALQYSFTQMNEHQRSTRRLLEDRKAAACIAVHWNVIHLLP